MQNNFAFYWLHLNQSALHLSNSLRYFQLFYFNRIRINHFEKLQRFRV